MAYYIVLPFCLAMSLVFCIRRGKGFSVSNLILKSISSLCFILTGVVATLVNPEAIIYGLLIIFGGVLGFLGDISLDLKGIYPQDEKTYMYAGFISFLVGHIFYSGAVIFTSKMKLWIILLCILIGIILAFCNYLSARITKLEFESYKAIVIIYSVVLFTTTAFAVAAAIVSGFAKEYVVFAIGLISFTLSDAILSMTFFGKNNDTFMYYFTNHLTYYAGQYLIAASILFI